MSARLALAILFACAAGGLLFGDEFTDRQIEHDAGRSWQLQDELAGHVRVAASDGIATLTGRVTTPDQKVLAVTEVDLIANVRGVDDQIQVGGPKTGRSDGWILLHLKADLLMRRDVSATETGVEVRDGEVILTGSSPTSAQKELTERYARGVEGVRAVLDEMTIGMQFPRLPRRSTFTGDARAGRFWADSAISGQVRNEFAALHIRTGFRLHVSTVAGVVRLSGEAYNEDEKELAARAAASISGVRGVVDNLRVRGQ
ncbi:MAG TPA: BON domain-containing protein [Opitutaceae bacterium]